MRARMCQARHRKPSSCALHTHTHSFVDFFEAFFGWLFAAVLGHTEKKSVCVYVCVCVCVCVGDVFFKSFLRCPHVTAKCRMSQKQTEPSKHDTHTRFSDFVILIQKHPKK